MQPTSTITPNRFFSMWGSAVRMASKCLSRETESAVEQIVVDVENFGAADRPMPLAAPAVTTVFPLK